VRVAVHPNAAAEFLIAASILGGAYAHDSRLPRASTRTSGARRTRASGRNDFADALLTRVAAHPFPREPSWLGVLDASESGSFPTAKRSREKRPVIIISRHQLAAVDDFRLTTRMPTRAATVRELLRRGLASEGNAAASDTKSAEFDGTGSD
jgi:hypothetical protein